jgi:GDP-D-mannose dehydratase
MANKKKPHHWHRGRHSVELFLEKGYKVLGRERSTSVFNNGSLLAVLIHQNPTASCAT